MSCNNCKTGLNMCGETCVIALQRAPVFNSFCSKVARVCCLFYRGFKFPNDRARKIMDKSLGTLLRFWGVFQFTQVQPLPSPHKQCWTRASRIFFRVSTLYRVGGGRTARKFRKECTVLTGNREMTEKYEYYSTVSGTFV